MGRKDQDPDGDGIVNLNEFIAGTDVSSPTSKFQASFAGSGNGVFALSYPSCLNRYFQILMCTNLMDGSWTNVTAAMLGVSGMVTNSVTNNAVQAFYKIEPSLP